MSMTTTIRKGAPRPVQRQEVPAQPSAGSREDSVLMTHDQLEHSTVRLLLALTVDFDVQVELYGRYDPYRRPVPDSPAPPISGENARLPGDAS
jgi:hypothetical protein